MRLIKINQEKITPEELLSVIDTDTDIKSLRNEIGCKMIDSIYRYIGGQQYMLYIDDMGKFADNACVTAICENANEHLVGNIIISGIPLLGKGTELSEDDIKNIQNNVCTMKEPLKSVLCYTV